MSGVLNIAYPTCKIIGNRAWAAGAGEGPAAHCCLRQECSVSIRNPDATSPTVPRVRLSATGIGACETAQMHDDQTHAEQHDDDLAVGVGPWEGPWPTDSRLDPVLLAEGDRRNVVDRYRYWRVEAIVADLDTRRHDFHVAIENWQHDFNIGTVVRTANAFLAAAVHVVGRRRWNRRGAMVTDRYQHLHHHDDPTALTIWAKAAGLVVVGVDNLPGSVPLETVVLPRHCILLFGQEGPGLSPAAREAATMVCSIAQFGSTRSINAGVASGIAMHTWIRQHALTD